MLLNITTDKRLLRISSGCSYRITALRLLQLDPNLIPLRRLASEFLSRSIFMSTKTVACIGGGYWGKNIVRNLYDLGVLSRVCEVDADTRAQLKASYPNTTFTDSTERVFADPDTAGVFIATPAVSHGELVRQALLADKDVF